jgi:hypothetical protein
MIEVELVGELVQGHVKFGGSISGSLGDLGK